MLLLRPSKTVECRISVRLLPSEMKKYRVSYTYIKKSELASFLYLSREWRDLGRHLFLRPQFVPSIKRSFCIMNTNQILYSLLFM
jgi:hypothetical protein